jgi:hypothetical protein
VSSPPPAADPGGVAGPGSGHRAAALGLAAAAVAGTALSYDLASGGGILDRRWGLLVPLAGWAAAWLVGTACARRLPRRPALAAVLVAAVALRVAALAGPPTTSDDLFRYSWDGRVQAAGVNPYAHPPASPALEGLREPWLWPDPAGCADLDRRPGCTRINRPAEPTIYPPAAQAWFGALYRVAGIEARHKAWQVAGLGVDVVVVALLPLLLRAWRADERWTALYALAPFPVVEFVTNAHVDGLAVLLVAVALLLAARRRPGWAGAVLGVAALVKLYPAMLVVAVARSARGRVRAAAAATGMVAAGYAPHLLAVGTGVAGYLPGYLREEDYGGGRYLLAGLPGDLLGLPGWTAAVGAAAVVAAAAAWVLVRRPPPPRAATVLLGAVLLAATPVQPWYAVTLLFVATVAAAPAWAAVAAAGVPYYLAVILDHPHAVAIGRVGYGLAAALLVLCRVAGARRPSRDKDHTSSGSATTSTRAGPGWARAASRAGPSSAALDTR